MKKQEERQGKGNSGRMADLCALVKGGIVAAGAALFLLMLCSLLASMGVLKENLLDGCVLLSCVLGALMGGIYSIKLVGRAALPVGLGTGGVLYLLLLTVGVLLYDGAGLEQSGLQILCTCLCGGAAAGILGKKPKKKRRR